MEVINAKKDMLKHVYEKEEHKYQALKKQVDEFEAKVAQLQLDNYSLEHIVKRQDMEILNLNYEIQIVVHFKNEAILAKEQIQVTCIILMYILQHDAKHIQVDVDTWKTTEPCLSKHKLWEYGNLLMQSITLSTKQKPMETKKSDINDWWNLVQDFFQKNVWGLFDDHISNEG